MVRINRIAQTGLRIQAAMESPQRIVVRTNENSVRLDMPELLGGTNRGVMPRAGRRARRSAELPASTSVTDPRTVGS